MIERVRDGNQGFVIHQTGQHHLQTFPSAFGEQGLDEVEGEMNFIPFEHTQFSKDNTRAMALLIILFER